MLHRTGLLMPDKIRSSGMLGPGLAGEEGMFDGLRHEDGCQGTEYKRFREEFRHSRDGSFDGKE
jgi:hypothetical protein